MQTIFPYSAAAAAAADDDDTPAHFVAFCASRVRVRVHVPLDDLLHGRGNVKAGGVQRAAGSAKRRKEFLIVEENCSLKQDKKNKLRLIERGGNSLPLSLLMFYRKD